MNYDSGKLDYDLFRDLMATRILIERECARLACLHITEMSAAQLDRFADLMETGDQVQLVDTLFSFHRYIVQLAGNAIYAMIFNSFEGAIRRLTDLHYQAEEKLKGSVPLYKKMICAIRRGEPDAAGICMAEILVTASDNLRIMLGFSRIGGLLSAGLKRS
jgi:DNA-binding FadR family transcriptional regulator